MNRNVSERIQSARRIVIKIGSALLINQDGHINQQRLTGIASEIERLRKRGQETIVVSSGAIALGRRYLGIEQKQRGLDVHQASAASGQILLANAYHTLLGEHGIKVAQILLTLEDTENRRRYLNARNTLQTLLELEVVPVINENDTVATDEIRYGDNDRLAARVAQMMGADLLVLLSDVDGLYSKDPRKHTDAKHLSEIDAIDTNLESIAGTTTTEYGSGGMVTKLAAAKICMKAGCYCVIASGHENMPLQHVEQGGRCTLFVPDTTPQAARKGWIAGSLTPKGTIRIDAGAKTALLEGRSLLPIGVTEVTGTFDRGDAVCVVGPDQEDLARGLIAFSSSEAQSIQGLSSQAIASALGYTAQKTLIHRDNLVLM